MLVGHPLHPSLPQNTTRHLCPVAPNRLAERKEPPTQPGEVWQADITDVATREGWLYVADVMDAEEGQELKATAKA